MKGNKTMLEALQKRLGEEHAAIMQYMIQSEIADNWGYSGLAKELRSMGIAEMKHAEKHVERMVFLDTIPDGMAINPVKIGQTIVDFLTLGKEGESVAISLYNASIQQAHSSSDFGTEEMLEEILKDEEAHLNYFEGELVKVQQMGIQNYLSTKV